MVRLTKMRFSCEGAERLCAKRPRQLQTLVRPQCHAQEFNARRVQRRLAP